MTYILLSLFSFGSTFLHRSIRLCQEFVSNFRKWKKERGQIVKRKKENLLSYKKWPSLYVVFDVLSNGGPGVNFINILHARFSYKILVPKITKPNITREKRPKRLTYKKCVHKTLMKLTPDHNNLTSGLAIRSASYWFQELWVAILR